MYTIGNRVYSEPGKYLLSDKSSGYCINIENTNIREIDVIIDNISIDGIFIIYSKNPELKIINHPLWTYAQWKDKLVKMRYTPEDQIAIMLNKDDSESDREYFNKMQAWREWCSLLAKQIILINNK